MNCYNHAETSAVGICKHCSKALCHECMTDTGVVACRSACKVDRSNATAHRLCGTVFLLSGFVFALRPDGRGSAILLVLMGIAFLLGPLLFFQRAKAINKTGS